MVAIGAGTALGFSRWMRGDLVDVHARIWPATHRGILYIDEVNLLNDHLVDILLALAVAVVPFSSGDQLSLRPWPWL
jgi:hypothetical protein